MSHPEAEGDQAFTGRDPAGQGLQELRGTCRPASPNRVETVSTSAAADHLTLERRRLFEALGISVVDLRCHVSVERAGPEEPNPTHSIVFVRRGVVRRMRQRESVIAVANHVLFFNQGELYRYCHPLPGGDDCTVLSVETRRVLELVDRYAPWDAQRPEAPFRLGHGLSSLRAVQFHWQLPELLWGPIDRLAVEDVLAELADEAVRSAYHRRPGGLPSLGAPSARERRKRDLVEAAKLALIRRLDAPRSLAELARGLDCSPFHLSRTFHGVAGLSLRSYVARLRTRLAAQRMAAGERDFTELALDLGFADHSHLTNSFRGEWGISPLRFRASWHRSRACAHQSWTSGSRASDPRRWSSTATPGACAAVASA